MNQKMTWGFYHLFTLLFCFTGHINAQEDIQLSSYKRKSVVWLDNAAFIVDHKNKSVRKLYSDVDHAYYMTEEEDYTVQEVEKMIANGADREYWEGKSIYKTIISNEMLSVVGPYVSYQRDYYYDGGAHPSYGSGFVAYNLKTDTSVRLQDIFDEKDVLNALQKDEFIQSNLTEERYFSSLQSLFEHLDGECNHYFSMENLEHFAFHHIKGNEVAVRIGISYGCEVMRGNFSQIEIYLPIPASLKKIFNQAKEKGTLMADLK